MLSQFHAPCLLVRRFAGTALAAALVAAFAALASCQNPSADYSNDAQALEQLSKQPLDAHPWQFAEHSGVMIATPHYRIYTTVQNGLYQRLLTKVLEGAHARAVALNPGSTVNGPLNCFVFGTRNQWEIYTRQRAGSNAPIYLQITAGGYCQEGVFAGYDIGREQTLSVIAHEAWHQYSWFAFKDRLPSWLEEGLATQNEGIDWDGTDPVFKPEQNYRRYQALKQAIRENRLWHIPDLLRNHAGIVIRMQQKSVDSYYAQLWSMVLFLENSPRYRPGMLRMLADAKAGKLAAALSGTGVSREEIENFTEHWNTVAGPVYFKKYISADPAEFEAQYVAWCRELTSTSWPPKVTQGPS